MENLINTYGFDLRKVIEEAKANGNVEFAELAEKQIANLQACFETLAQRNSSASGEELWKIDAEYLKTLLK